MTNKPRIDPIEDLMKVKIDFKRMLKSNICEGIRKFIKIKLGKLELILEEYTGEVNREKVLSHVKNLESDTGGFNQLGMWKLKTKLCPKPVDPPMAKLDSSGKLVTRPNELKKLYLKTYSDRLEHRTMNAELDDIFQLKNELWKQRYEKCKQLKTPRWTEDDLWKVLKKLKNNKTRDPMGLINEIFKPGVIGQDLFSALLALLNESKYENFIPLFMRLTNITSITKNVARK